MLIDGFDQHCRYLSAPGGGLQYHFGTYLRQLNVKIEDEQLRTIVRAGWLRPLLRVRLPESFLLSWENYPLLSFKGSFAAEDLWANKLWIRAATMSGLSAENQWYKHYLDDGNCELTKNILMHTIATGPGAQEPEPIRHPRLNRLVYPWIDFFAYWQVYEMLELERARRLIGPILNGPGAEMQLEQVRQQLPELREWSDARLETVRRRWEGNRPVLEWVSRFRTMLGIWNNTHHDWNMVTDAAPRLFAELGLTSDLLRAGIRDVLLVQWRQWNPPNGENSGIRKPILAHFQQDIQHAVEFLEEATGQEVDLDDPYWGSSRRNMRWMPLADALPYESLGARREFPLYASMYLEKLNSLLGERRLDETRLKRLVEIWWPQSVAFRRFCLAFHRLHGHLGTPKDDKIGLRTETPVEFLILCTLHAEKILRDDHMARTMATRVAGVRVITTSCAEVVLRSFGIPEATSAVQELGNALKRRDQLHDLPENPRDPFVAPGYFALEGKLGQLILASFANFVILRNYVAHHDCLDDQLIYTEMGEAALNAVLIATLTILDREE